MKQVHRKSNVNANDAVLHLFDLVPLAAFQQGKYKVAQTARLQKLQDWKDTRADATPNIQVLGSETVDLDTAAGEQRFKDINAEAIRGGYEGIMIKDLDASYETKRTTAWLKRKPFLEVSLTVVGLEEGTGKNAGRLGALICEGTDDGKKIRTNVGSGLTDDLRLDIWSDQATVLGQVVEIRADATTRNQDSEDIYSLRFPRFIRFRGFEKGEKI
jgi:DNA ligase-1